MKELLDLLGIDDRVQKLCLGNISVFREYSGWEYYGLNEVNLKKNHAYPPLFLPIIINYDATPISYGITKQWFTGREYSFTYMEFSEQFLNAEIARTADQFIDNLVFEYFIDSIEDNDISDSKKYTVLNQLRTNYSFEEIKRISRLNSTQRAQLLNSYKEHKPLWMFVNNVSEYKGAFPTAESILNQKALFEATFFEISHKEWIGYNAEKSIFSFLKKESKYKALDNIPEWLKPETDKKESFEKYISSGEFNKAWLIINGPGFNPIEVGERLQRLKEFSDEKAYHLWADFWCDRYGDMDSFIFV
ncbi:MULTISPECIES: hypothetical protein [Chryseobacterium]|uniref:Uncharacterized protein n=2 Tax=Chryseobacterium TaxID=59732 RepID=A0A511Y7U2_9FLAO|nr:MULTISPECIES: hypothetical protein [Chryseobacterium]REC79468.1 hypothetical protein DRF60_06490 [Chryseobacterium elymi]GEN71261.1 hypothetical protein CLA01_13330 [Chryseobacterium lathyri]